MTVILQRFLVLALLLVLQGPAMLVQEVAWVGMLVSYTRENGLVRGTVETFDGSRPCPLCRKAEGMRKNEATRDVPDGRQDLARWAKAWKELLPGSAWKLPGHADGRDGMTGTTASVWFAVRAGDEPPLPPPRILA